MLAREREKDSGPGAYNGAAKVEHAGLAAAALCKATADAEKADAFNN